MTRPSVFLNPVPQLPSKPGDLVAYLGMELSICERLIGMGYATSGTVRLVQHVRWLEDRINLINPKGRR
jgi:hypothetical protein